jgi:hypothetical protein
MFLRGRQHLIATCEIQAICDEAQRFPSTARENQFIGIAACEETEARRKACSFLIPAIATREARQLVALNFPGAIFRGH